jgi:hypothetical protein
LTEDSFRAHKTLILVSDNSSVLEIGLDFPADKNVCPTDGKMAGKNVCSEPGNAVESLARGENGRCKTLEP